MTGLPEEIAEISAINSEIRFLTLELMKIAAIEGKTFSEVLKEFTANAVKLKKNMTRQN